MRRSLLRVALVVSLWTTLVAPLGASAQSPTVLTFTPVADTNVSSQRPTRSYGTATTVEVDASPTKQGFLRFDVSGLDGLQVSAAILRMYQVDASGTGGRVFEISSDSWTESMTYNTRPAIDGAHLATFGPVKAGYWYEVDVTNAVTGNGPVSLAIDTTSTNGADWSSRETSFAPQLVVTAASTSTPPAPSGLTQVAASTDGSSDPTYFSTNHRVAVTASGRLLTVYGLHRRGVQLEWKDPGGAWSTRTTGATGDGVLHDNGQTGDRPASIAVAPGPSGAEHAWVVWSGENTWSNAPVSMRRLSDLDSPSGPTVGPEVRIDTPAYGAYKPDIAFERGPDGTLRGTILWSRKVSDTVHEVVAAWFTDLGTDTPAVHGHRTLLSSSSSGRYGTLTATPNGMRAVTRTSSGYLRMFGHNNSAALSDWWSGATGTIPTDGYATPSATTLGSGEVLVAIESDSATGRVLVQRFSTAGTAAAPELTVTGYSHPTIASDGSRAWVVMVRRSDGVIVSREYSPATGWATTDRVEVGPEGGGFYEYPNVLREATSSLVFVVRGPKADDTHSSVLAYERGL